MDNGQAEIICHLLLSHRKPETLADKASAAQSHSEVESHCRDAFLGIAPAEASYPSVKAALVLADLPPKPGCNIGVIPGQFQHLAVVEKLDRDGA